MNLEHNDYLWETSHGALQCKLIAQENDNAFLFGYLAEASGMSFNEMARLIEFYNPMEMTVDEIMELFDSIHLINSTK